MRSIERGLIRIFFKDSGTKTLLGKIVGVYKVGYKSVTGTGMKMDLLIIENLFYKKEVDKSYDLKVFTSFNVLFISHLRTKLKGVYNKCKLRIGLEPLNYTF